MLYKGIELRNEDIEEKGIELLIGFESKIAMDDDLVEDKLYDTVDSLSDDIYIENPCDGYFEIRSDEGFTFDKQGIKLLKKVYKKLLKAFPESLITVEVFTNDFLFNNGEHNQDSVSLEEFEKNIKL